MTKDRETRMIVNKYADSVYVATRGRTNKKSYTLIEEVPGVEHVTTSSGYSVGARFSPAYDPEEVAAQMVIILAREGGIDPADVALQGDIAKETRQEMLTILYMENREQIVLETVQMREAEDRLHNLTERSNRLQKKIEEEAEELNEA